MLAGAGGTNATALGADTGALDGSGVTTGALVTVTDATSTGLDAVASRTNVLPVPRTPAPNIHRKGSTALRRPRMLTVCLTSHHRNARHQSMIVAQDRPGDFRNESGTMK